MNQLPKEELRDNEVSTTVYCFTAVRLVSYLVSRCFEHSQPHRHCMSRPAICFQRSCRIMRLGRESFWNLPCFLGSGTFFLDSRLPYYKFFVTEIKDTTRKKSISELNDSVYMYTLSFVFLCFMHYPVLICLLESRSRAVFLGGQSHQPGGTSPFQHARS